MSLFVFCSPVFTALFSELRLSKLRLSGLRRLALVVFLALGGLGLSGCVYDNYRTGNRPLQSDVAKLVPNQSSKQDALEELGSPSSVSPFNPDIWYYISQRRGRRTALNDEISEQLTLALYFDPRGIFTGAEVYGLDQARDITPNSDFTPTKGKQSSFLEELFGGLRRPSLPGS